MATDPMFFLDLAYVFLAAIVGGFLATSTKEEKSRASRVAVEGQCPGWPR